MIALQRGSVLLSGPASLSFLTRFAFLPNLVHKRAGGSSPLVGLKLKWKQPFPPQFSTRKLLFRSPTPTKSPKISFFTFPSIPTEKPKPLNKYKWFMKTVIATIDWACVLGYMPWPIICSISFSAYRDLLILTMELGMCSLPVIIYPERGESEV